MNAASLVLNVLLVVFLAYDIAAHRRMERAYRAMKRRVESAADEARAALDAFGPKT